MRGSPSATLPADRTTSPNGIRPRRILTIHEVGVVAAAVP